MREEAGIAKRELLGLLTATIVLGAALALALMGGDAPVPATSDATGHTHPPGYPAHEHTSAPMPVGQ